MPSESASQAPGAMGSLVPDRPNVSATIASIWSASWTPSRGAHHTRPARWPGPPLRDLTGQRGLADASRARQGQDPGPRQRLPNRIQFFGASYEVGRSRGHRTRHESVADLVHREDVHRPCGVALDLLAEALDEVVDRSRAHVRPVSPHLPEQRLAGHRVPFGEDERREKSDLQLGQPFGAIRAGEGPTAQVDLARRDGEDGGLGRFHDDLLVRGALAGG